MTVPLDDPVRCGCRPCNHQAHSWTNLAEICRHRPRFNKKLRPNIISSSPQPRPVSHLAEFPKDGQVCVSMAEAHPCNDEARESSTEPLTQDWPNGCVQIAPELGPSRPQIYRNRPHVVKIAAGLPTSADFEQTSE